MRRLLAATLLLGALTGCAASGSDDFPSFPACSASGLQPGGTPTPQPSWPAISRPRTRPAVGAAVPALHDGSPRLADLYADDADPVVVGGDADKDIPFGRFLADRREGSVGPPISNALVRDSRWSAAGSA